jgi:hypothetical protein
MPKMIREQEPSQDEIARLAYEFWEQNAKPTGRELDFWLHAEQLLRSSVQTSPVPEPQPGIPQRDLARNNAFSAKADVASTPPLAIKPSVRKRKKATPLGADAQAPRQ